MYGKGLVTNGKGQQALGIELADRTKDALAATNQGLVTNAKAQEAMLQEIANGKADVEVTVQFNGKEISVNYTSPDIFGWALSGTTAKGLNASIEGFYQNDVLKVKGAPAGKITADVINGQLSLDLSKGQIAVGFNLNPDSGLSYSSPLHSDAIEINEQKSNDSGLETYKEYNYALQQATKDKQFSHFQTIDIIDDDEYEIDYDYYNPDFHHHPNEAFGSPIEDPYNYAPFIHPGFD